MLLPSLCLFLVTQELDDFRVELRSEQHVITVDGEEVHRSTAPITDLRRLTFAAAPTDVVLWNESQDSGAALARYLVSPDGERWWRPRTAETTIDMLRARFDPLVAVPDFSSSPLGAGGQLYLLQYVTAPLAAYADELAARGVRVHRFTGGQAVIAEIPREALSGVQGLPFVRWVGAYHSEYRLESALLEGLNAGTLPEQQRYRIQVTERGPSMQARVAQRIETMGAKVDSLTPSGFLLDATLTAEALVEVAGWNEVLWIDRWFPVTHYMDKVRQDGGADYLESVAGFTGQGVRAEVLDIGVHAGHPDFQSPPLLIHGSAGSNGFHGTEVSGIVFSSALGNARGLLPDAQGIFSSVQSLGDRYAHTAELLQPPYEAVFQTNSWGREITTNYTNNTFEMDDIAFIYDITILQAQANNGNRTSDAFAWAKNVVSVGGILHRDTANLLDDAWQNAGSIGPAADGRIKPDLSYWYDSIRTTSGTSGYTSSFGGTSAATPMTAGYFGLFFQMWHAGVFGNAPTGSSVFESRPASSTARAVMINTADSYPFSGTNADLTRVHQGWGRADVQRLYDQRGKLFVLDEALPLRNMQSVSYQLSVTAGEPELRATMVYLDPAGTTSASQHRINDLSLKVTSPSGVTYWGNNGLLAGNASSSGGSSNTVDTVENVRVPNPEGGNWTVEVLADEVVADAFLGTHAIDAAFALAVSGIDPLWTDLGNALAGTNGDPNLIAQGWLVGRQPLTLSTSNALANAPGFLVYGLSRVDFPLLGGVLVPSPVTILPITTDASGSHSLTQTLPPTLAAGTSLYAQTWILDPAASQGASASNAVRIVTP